MLEAFVHGKLSSEQENMEDLLTSCVFGGLKLMAPSAGLLSFLARAERYVAEPDLGFPLSQLGELGDVKPTDIEYMFWPMLDYPERHRCEPDLLLKLKTTNQLILVEAKLGSGKSSVANAGPWPYDQLAREWDNLLAKAKNCQPIMIYLTADQRMPRNSIAESIAEFKQKRPSLPPPDICWLSWHHLRFLEPDPAGIVENLLAVIKRLDLLPFDGFDNCRFIQMPSYKFAKPTRSFAWDCCKRVKDHQWSFCSESSLK